MKYFWITLSLLIALSIGCNSDSSSDDPATDDGSANVTSDSGTDGTVDLPPMDETELTSTDEPTEFASGDLPDEGGLPTEDPKQAIREDVNNRLNAALQQRDVASALAVIEDGMKQLPDDPDMATAFIALRIQNDMRLAVEDERDVAVASIKETEDAITKLLGEAPELPPRMWQFFHINQSRRHAHANDIENTLAALGKAGESGFGQFAAVVNDPFFEAIKEKEEFQQGVKILYRDMAVQKLATAESFDFDFELTDLENNPIKLADYAGKVVIVDIWGTWCPPCKAEIPHFVQLQETFKDDLAIVGITYERHDDEDGSMAGIYENDDNRAEVVQRVVEFAKEQGINYSVALGDQATQQMITPPLEGFPTTIFVDRDGKVRLTVVGYHPYEQLESYVAALLAEDGEKEPAG